MPFTRIGFPTCRSDFTPSSFEGGGREFSIANNFWSMWSVRNNWVFNNKLLSNVINLPHQVISLLSHWRRLAPAKWRGELDVLRGFLLVNMQEIEGSPDPANAELVSSDGLDAGVAGL